MAQTTNMEDWRDSLCQLSCEEELAKQIVRLVEARDYERAAELLRRQKRTLLTELHGCESKVDLADFLLYQLKQAKLRKDRF